MKQVIKALVITLVLYLSSVTNVIGRKSDTVSALDKATLWQEIKALNIKFPEFVFAQALLESGNFTSKLARRHNNLFGMKVPSKRETLAIKKSKSGYAVYSHWRDSVRDYLLFQEYVMKRHDTEKEYIAYISRRYSETPDYLIKVKKVIKSNKALFNS